MADEQQPTVADTTSGDADTTDTGGTDQGDTDTSTDDTHPADTPTDDTDTDQTPTDAEVVAVVATDADDRAPDDADTSADDTSADDTSDADTSADDTDSADTEDQAPDTDTTDTDGTDQDTTDDQGDADTSTDDTDQTPIEAAVVAVVATDTDDQAPDTTDADTAGTDQDATDDQDDADTSVDDTDTTDHQDDSDTSTDDSDTSTDAAVVTIVATDTDGSEPVTATELAAEIERLEAEYAALEQRLDTTTKTKTKRLHRPTKHWLAIAFVVMGAVLLPFAVLVRWTSNTVLDTDSYVETVAPLAQNADIQEAVSFHVSVLVMDVTDFRQQVAEALPTGARFLAAPIESGARALVQDVVEELVSTDAFESLWEEANRIGHDNVVAVLTGQGNDTVDTANGKVVVQLGPLAKEVIKNLDDILGTSFFDSIPDEDLGGEFVLLQSDDLASLQDEIRWFDRLSWFIPILTIALLAASVVLSRPRRLGFLRLGIAIVVPMTISLLLYSWIRSRYVGGLPDDIHNPDAAAAFFDITTRFVPRDLGVLLVIGLVILFLAWLFGPTGWAGRSRAWWNRVVGRAGDATEDRDVGEMPRWVSEHQRALLVGAVALGALTLLVWTRPTGLVVLTVIVVVALLMGTTSVLAEIGRRANARDADIVVDDAIVAESTSVE